MIFLVHHADAVGPDVEPQRPLSLGGRTGNEDGEGDFPLHGLIALEADDDRWREAWRLTR